jgi:hypothetical protein
VVNKIKLTVVRKTRERFLSSEFKVWNESRSFSSSSLNEYSVSSALLATVRTFAEMGVILRHFLRLTSPEMPPVFKDSGPRKGARGGERVRDIDPCRAYSQAATPSPLWLRVAGGRWGGIARHEAHKHCFAHHDTRLRLGPNRKAGA